jgi:DNA-binding transcriptional regulator YdaS (Cro superfamily)
MNPIERAIEAAGGVKELARLCGISYEAVRKWQANQWLPAERVLEVERFSGVPRQELRPDLYPRETVA